VRWLIVKLINFAVVLVLVTIIVAAVFTGPLAERERLSIQQNTKQEIIMKYKGQNIPQDVLREIIENTTRQRIKAKGLDKPWYILSFRYTKDLLTFKALNASVLTTLWWPTQGSRNTLYIIAERLPFSILLFTTSSVLTLVLALPLALYASRRPGSPLDSTIIGWSVFSVSMPWWWLAMVFIFFLSVKTRIFPSPYTVRNVDWTNPIELIKMSALPVFTVTILSVGDSAFRLRNIFLDIFNEDFVMVARAKGMPERMVLRKQILRAAAPPVVTIVLFSIVLSVFSGAIITELIFNWPGLGRLYWEAISQNDVPVILELTYVTTLLYLLLRFILDILYTLLDPRIKRA